MGRKGKNAMAEPYKILVNKKLPPPQAKMKGSHFKNYGLRESIAKVLRGEVRNVVYAVSPNNLHIARAISDAARHYIRRHNLPLVQLQRYNFVFIVTEEAAKIDKRKRNAPVIGTGANEG